MKRKREAIAELFGRAPVPAIDLQHPPLFPGGSSSSGDVHSLLVGLVSSVNEVRSSLANMATRNELQELHALQMDEVKTYVSVQLEPIKRTMVTPDVLRHEISVSEARARTYIDSQIAKAASAGHNAKTLTALIKRQQTAIDKLRSLAGRRPLPVPVLQQFEYTCLSISPTPTTARSAPS